MANKLGQLVIELAANTARLQTDMGKAVGIAEKGAAGMKRAFSFVTTGVGGGLIATALIGAAKRAIQLGDELQRAAQKSGLGGKAISELAYAARLADVELGSLSTALKKMQVSLSEANSGGKEQLKTLDALGLSIGQIIGLKPDKQFELLAQQISRLKDPADRARAATQLFGKAGADLLPLFAQGAEGIRKAREEAQKLGFSFDDATLSKFDAADDAIKRLKASWEAFTVTLTAKVAPALTKVLDDLSTGGARRTGSFAVGQAFLGPALAGYNAFFSDRFDKKPQGGRGRPGGDASSLSEGPIGFAEQAKADAAEAQRLAEDTAAVVVKAAKVSTDAVTELYEQWKASALSTYDLETKAFYERVAKLDELREVGKISGEQYARAFTEALDDVLAEVEVTVKKVSVETTKTMSAGAEFFRDSFMMAFDDLLSTGKVHWDDLLRYMVSQLLKAQFAKMMQDIFAQGAGWFTQLLGAFAGAYNPGVAPARAAGGPVQAGKTYMVGEKGVELFKPNASGTIIPNHAMGGGISVTVVNHIDARGATVDAIKLLPSFGKQISEQTEARIVERLRRDHYGMSRG